MDFPDQINNRDPKRSQPARTQTTPHRVRYAYQIDRLNEGVLSTIFFGSATINEKKLQQHINTRAAQGYRLVFQIMEKRRTLLFGTRESLILTFELATS